MTKSKKDSDKKMKNDNEQENLGNPAMIDEKTGKSNKVSDVIHDCQIDSEYKNTDKESTKTGSKEIWIKKPHIIQKITSLFKKSKIMDVLGSDIKCKTIHETSHIPNQVIKSILEPNEIIEHTLESNKVSDHTFNKKYIFDAFVDERILVSRDAFAKKEMKIKALEISDETPPAAWKLGKRVKLDKILVIIKHLETQEIEEGEFDIKTIEEELSEKRHYTSSNRWVPTNDIKNGYITSSRHVQLISDAIALDYIIF